MQGRFNSSNVKFETLIDNIKAFFAQRGFNVSVSLQNDSAEISASKGKSHRLINVTATKDLDCYLVVFMPGDNSRLSRLGNLLGPFGAGALALLDSKNEERLMKLENDFWGNLDALFFP
jgi:hypothetical protein